MGFLFLTSGLFLGWSLGANDHGNVFGAPVQTKMMKFIFSAILGSVFVILGAMIEGSGAAATLNKLGSVNAAAGTFTVALATAITVALMTKLKLPVSTSQAIVGGIIGWNLFAEMLTDYSSLANIVISWVAAPLLAGIFSFLLYHLFKGYIARTKIHLLQLDSINRWGYIIIGAFGAYSLGANNIANVVGIFINNSPFKDITLFNLVHITNLQQLYFWGAVSIAVGIFTYSKKVITTIGSDVYKLSPMTGLIVVLAEAIVLYLFGSKGLQLLLYNLHLPTIPLVPISSSQAIIGAVLGIGFVKGGRNVNYGVLGRISLGWITTPALSCLLAFVMLFFVQNVFEQPVVNKIYYVFNRPELVELEKRGINLDYLSEVNGRKYESAQAVHKSLNKIKQLSQKEKLILTSVTGVHNMKVNYAELTAKLRPKTFSEAQWAALKQLDGKTYDHMWQLKADLVKLSEEWKLKPKKYKYQIYNENLKSKYNILSSNCTIKEPNTEESQ